MLGEKISEMLQKRGIQQKELAEQIGITEAAMSRYIAGTREPKPDVIANMATALHTTSDYLLGIENDAFNYHQVRRLIARNASSMTDQEKKALIDALFVRYESSKFTSLLINGYFTFTLSFSMSYNITASP